LKGYIENNTSLGELVRQLENEFTRGTTQISKYVSYNLHDNIEKIDAYLNSKHTSGEFDSLGREKPFFNIVTAAVNIWYRATDIDRSNIKIKATTSSEEVASFLATVHLQDWMRRDNFGAFLNEWGRVLARYGSAVCKFVEQEGSLHAMVTPWDKIIIDPVEFDGNVTIEILDLTPSQLRKRKGYDQEIVNKLCSSVKSRQTMEGQNKDNRGGYIRLYEVHGEMPVSYLTGNDKDNSEYCQQMHIISFLASDDKGGFEDYALYSGRESKHPYMITHLIKEDGRAMGIGSVEHLFEAQWMANHSIKMMKDQLDLASKMIFQTSDATFSNQNALINIENGDILTHKINEPLTQINNGSHDVSVWQSYLVTWKSLANEVTGVSESMMGQNPPSGTAWRLTETLLNENHSLFELMTENKGLHIEEMLRQYVIPFLKTKMDTSKEVAATLESHDIAKVDSKFIKNITTNEVNKIIVQKVLNGEMPTPEDQSMMTQQVQGQAQEQLNSMGNVRFFKPSEISDTSWKEIFKDLEWEVEVDVTHESSNAKDDLVTLSTVLQTIANPQFAQVLNTPQGKTLFNLILQKAGGVSPLQMSDMPSTPTISSIPSPILTPNASAVGGAGGNLASK
jgi:hypothetical protein